MSEKFFDQLPREDSPRVGDVLRSNSARVLLCKVLPYRPDSGLAPACILLCRTARTRLEYVTWRYNEQSDGCDHGHYHEGNLAEAFADWVERV